MAIYAWVRTQYFIMVNDQIQQLGPRLLGGLAPHRARTVKYKPLHQSKPMVLSLLVNEISLAQVFYVRGI